MDKEKNMTLKQIAQEEKKETLDEPDLLKREFMKKFGSYAATVPFGMYLLMSPSQAKAGFSDMGG